MTSLRLVIFDVDGTLVDSQADIIASMRAAFAGQGLEAPTDEATRGIVGLSLPVAMAVLAPEQTTAVQDALVAGYKTSYQALRLAHGAEGSPLFPGARASLDRLTDDPFLQLAIATGKSRRGLDGLIDAHGLQGIFSSQQVADDHPSKPHPSMVEACLRETGVDKAQAVIVGDTEYDMEMGKAAGIHTIGVTWGYHPRERLAKADVLIDGYDQLDAALAKIWGQA
ncbi:HAD-IA family hydrolase [Pararhodobacter sp. CCB-MM2]|uniref:HAD-IA family hydrolase n=1 Tax=Pararhodobacter sp. CCB-MM2 TaxID=1786003 RepID=UPI0008324CC0|nr:HAD-IA family hydrolase [Pararhodobacter sp. CCB-MM2]